MSVNDFFKRIHDVKKVVSSPQLSVCVVIPSAGPNALTTPDALGGILLKSVGNLATQLISAPASQDQGQVTIIAYDNSSNCVLNLNGLWQVLSKDYSESLSGESWVGLDTFVRASVNRVGKSHKTPQVLLFVSVSYLLRQNSPPIELARLAHLNGLACSGTCEGDLYAVALLIPSMGNSRANMPGLLGRLSSPISSRLTPQNGHSDVFGWVPVETSGPSCSPVLSGITPRHTTRPFDAPPAVNVALAEAVFHPADQSPIGDSPKRLRSALIRQGETSAAPWIFNELLNAVEYSMGHCEPESIPPEMHISISGLCNIECQFCSYRPVMARKDRVSVNQISRLAFLRHVRTLRLHAGNGEPTTNPALLDIIRYVEKAFPQISMNFFTNGIMLDRPGLIPGLVGSQVTWISVSINAATQEGWKKLCGADHFNRVCSNLAALQFEKQSRAANSPVIYGSMVLTRTTAYQLPRMPELCRRLGVDRFTAIPFFSLGYEFPDRLRSEDAYHHIKSEYDHIYSATVAEAQRCKVSIELPMPRDASVASYGVEQRAFHDFANIEPNDSRVSKLLCSFSQKPSSDLLCRYLWCQAAVGSTNRGHGEQAESHYLYPCLGPLVGLNLAPQTPFRFPDEDAFKMLWRNPLFTLLREAQLKEGRVPVCDTCRKNDSRAPESLKSVEAELRSFAQKQGL